MAISAETGTRSTKAESGVGQAALTEYQPSAVSIVRSGSVHAIGCAAPAGAAARRSPSATAAAAPASAAPSAASFPGPGAAGEVRDASPRGSAASSGSSATSASPTSFDNIDPSASSAAVTSPVVRRVSSQRVNATSDPSAKAAHSRSERPASQATDSTCTGWSANSAPAATGTASGPHAAGRKRRSSAAPSATTSALDTPCSSAGVAWKTSRRPASRASGG